MGQAGRRADGAGGRRAKVESWSRSSKRRPLSFSLSCSSPTPTRLLQRWRLAAVPVPPQSVGAAGGRARRRRRGGSEARRRGGGVERLDAQGKLRTGARSKKRASGSAAVDSGLLTAGSRRVRRRGRIRVLGRRGRAGRCRRPHPSSFARLHPRTHSPLPCEWRRAPTRIRPRPLLAAGGRWQRPWRRRGPRGVTGLCTRLSRRHCSGTTKGHPGARLRGRGAGGDHLSRLHPVAAAGGCSRSGGGGGTAATGVRPPPTFGGSQLPPHACCGGPWSTFAVLLHCRLPPYPPIRVAPSATRPSPDPPGRSFPSNPTPRAQHMGEQQTHSNSSTKHMYVYVKHDTACKGDASLMVRGPVLGPSPFWLQTAKTLGLGPKTTQTPPNHQGFKDKEGNCNILYHSLPFACICAGTHLSIRAVTAFVSIVRRSLLRVFHSLVFSFHRSSQLARHTHGRRTQLSLCCIGFGSPRLLGARLTREKHAAAATAARRAASQQTTHAAQEAQQHRGRTAATPTQHYVRIHTRG